MTQEITQLRKGKIQQFVLRVKEANGKTEQIPLQNLSLNLCSAFLPK